MSAPLPPAQHGAVLAGLKAQPSGWPLASLDPGSGRHPPAGTRSREQKGSDKIRPLRFQGIAGEPPRRCSTSWRTSMMPAAFLSALGRLWRSP